MNDRSKYITRIIVFALVVIFILAIVGYSVYLFTRGREEKISEWGGAESADILDNSMPESYSLPFGKALRSLTRGRIIGMSQLRSAIIYPFGRKFPNAQG